MEMVCLMNLIKENDYYSTENKIDMEIVISL